MKPAIKYTPTPEQIKWDIEDKSFLDVGFSKDEPEIKEKLVEIEEDG